jgi:hypothetical protein
MDQELSHLHTIRTGSEGHPTFCPIGTGGIFPGVKLQWREADHPPPAITDVKKVWIDVSTPSYASIA